MSTKRSAKSCKVTDRKIAKGEYGKLCKQALRYQATFFATVRMLAVRIMRVRVRGARVMELEPIPPPHEWPPWGGLCWTQAMEEMMSMMPLGYAASYYLMLASDPNATTQQINDAYLQYVTARNRYMLAWEGMETCLTTTV